MFLKKITRLTKVIAVLSALILTSCSSSKPSSGDIRLEKNWAIQSSSKITEKGEAISSVSFVPKDWVEASVPSTVLGALTDYGIYKDIYFAKNLDSIKSEPFKTSWWYRKVFEISDSIAFENATITFEGINYYANIWLNGKKFASADSIKGAFRVYEFDITKYLAKGKNVLAVEVIPPKPGDYYMGFVDWTPRPPDENMGLFRPVRIHLNGQVSIRHTFVHSKVNLKTLDEAILTIESEVQNYSNKEVKTRMKGVIENITFEEELVLRPLEHKKLVFPALNIKNPKLWWPYQYGEPALHKLKLECKTGSRISDEQTIQFGIREVADYMNESGYRGYMVNGKKIQIRGGGWTDELLLREDPKKVEAQVQLTKQMNLNTIRLEGFWGSSQKLYDCCDEAGVLLMPGWSCQWEWMQYVGGKKDDEFGSISTPEDMDLVAHMLRDQVKLFRNHPALFVWVIGSDKLPRPELEKKFSADLKILDNSRPYLGSCANRKSILSGPTGVKMEGPYEYVTPNYWYEDTKHGGAYGFNTETGPGPQVPPIETLRKMFPADKLWPVNDMWNYHCGRNEFHTINTYTNALNNRYGKAVDINEFVMKAQVVNYEAIRAMFEAFAVNRTKGTGVIQWMLNAAWPKLYWQLYDYYLTPNGAFYGTMAACRPINIIYDYGDRNLYATNDLYKELKGATAEIKIFDSNSKALLFQNVTVDLGENESKKIFEMPALKDLTSVYFLDLRLTNKEGTELARNFYWLSTKPDVLDEPRSDWFFTPNKSFADFTSLKNLPKVAIEVKESYTSSGDKQTVIVKVKNPSPYVAFFTEFKLKTKKTGELILPVFWTDNYLSILPGEEREVKATFNIADLKGDEPVLEYSGWNVKK
jgi:exo-1,4-beta-D-glucosaminidase